MKKFVFFLAPLMAISFLTNCNSGPKQYTVTVETHEHLSFLTTDGKDLSTIKAIEGQDFKFKIKVDETTSNDTTYKLPTQLSIYIGDSKFPLAKDVTITETTQYLEADVTIAANQITGDIKINGSAVPTDYYKITVFNYGVNIKSEDYNPDFPYAESNKSKDFTFVQDGTYALPTIKDIYLGVDGKNWISPEDSEYCSYDEANHKLTINANKVNSNLTIAVRSPNYNLLENLDWNDINDCSKSGHAPALFKIGEEKTIQLKNQNIKHKVRIIDFNHDDLWDGKGSAGITFEFVNLLSDSSGYSLATLWDTTNKQDSTNYNYLDSDLRKALDGSGAGTLRWYQKEAKTKSTDSNYTKPVIEMLPDELRNNIKTVKKYVAKDASYTVKDYDAKVFVLTHDEMTTESDSYAKAEGTTYQYYKDHKDYYSRIKYQIKWHDKAVTSPTKINGDGVTWSANNYAGYNNSIDSYGGYYWLTSPRTSNSNNAWYVYHDGHLYSYHVCHYAFAVAPAFCI